MWECVCLYGVDLLNFTIIFHGYNFWSCVLPTHPPPVPSHTQQEMVTSGIIPEFAEEIVAVAEGGEMVRKEAGREGGEEGQSER